MEDQLYDVVVVGGGPAGATAANDLARRGHSVLLIERSFRIKPCGGAIPPRCIEEFEIPQQLLVAKIQSARMISPANQRVDMPIADTYVGMVDREAFDPWLRQRAADAGVTVVTGAFDALAYRADNTIELSYRDKSQGGEQRSVRARSVIGADGAKSRVARQCVPGADALKCVFAYHEIIESPTDAKAEDFDGARCVQPGDGGGA